MYICVCVCVCVRVCVCVCGDECPPALIPSGILPQDHPEAITPTGIGHFWPSHDIVSTNIEWSMAYSREVAGGSCIAQ